MSFKVRIGSTDHNGDYMRKVLIVEDTSAILETLKQVFEFEFPDTVVHALSNAEEAVEIWMTDSFDVVISDFNLPGMDGQQMVALMREHKPEQAVIFISANTGKVDDLLALGFPAIKKPFTIAQFLKLLIETLPE